MRLIPVLLLFAFSQSAFAHPQAGGGLLHGFAHPFTGADHLAAMVIVGLWAARYRGRARLALPAVFVASLLAGVLAGLAGVPLPEAEWMIGLSIVVFAAALIAGARIRLPLGMALAGGFALFHGYAHMAEMPQEASVAAFAAGMVAGSGVLHAIGLGIGLALAARWTRFA